MKENLKVNESEVCHQNYVILVLNFPWNFSEVQTEQKHLKPVEGDMYASNTTWIPQVIQSVD